MLPCSRISSIPSWQPRHPFSLDIAAVIFSGTSPSEKVETNEFGDDDWATPEMGEINE